MRAMRIAFSFASVPELQKKAFESCAGAMETNFSAARANNMVIMVHVKKLILSVVLAQINLADNAAIF